MLIKQIELHTHLEGTIQPELAQQLAQRNRIKLPTNLLNENTKGYHFDDFAHFLNVYDIVAGVIKQPRDYYDITLQYLQARAQEQAIYVEMMYSPDHAEMVSGIPSIEHLTAIQAAINDAQAKFDIIGRIIITAVRHFGAEKAVAVAKEAVKQHTPMCVVGFGLGGDEINFPPELFIEAYQIAANNGLSCTVHAGEFASAQTMLTAIKYLPIQRIGHGVRAIDCQETLAILRDKRIALEVCPTSNIVFGIYPSMQDHPFKRLVDSGILVSINSDDPPFVGTQLAKEYQHIQQTFAYTDAEMINFSKMAIDAAFVDNITKQQLHQQLTIH